MIRPASEQFIGALQVLSCYRCRSILNGHWFYREVDPVTGEKNPYCNKCHACGSFEFGVGETSRVNAVWLEKQGWWLIPIHQEIRVSNPFLRRNIFDVKGS